jgi:hypothetical protein
VEYKQHIINLMSLDPTWLFLSLIPGGIGFVLMVYGKKQQRWPILGFGVAFMVYPYFTESAAALAGVGAILGVLLWTAVRLGW